MIFGTIGAANRGEVGELSVSLISFGRIGGRVSQVLEAELRDGKAERATMHISQNYCIYAIQSCTLEWYVCKCLALFPCTFPTLLLIRTKQSDTGWSKKAIEAWKSGAKWVWKGLIRSVIIL